jgi:hypothetical protein
VDASTYATGINSEMSYNNETTYVTCYGLLIESAGRMSLSLRRQPLICDVESKIYSTCGESISRLKYPGQSSGVRQDPHLKSSTVSAYLVWRARS